MKWTVNSSAPLLLFHSLDHVSTPKPPNLPIWLSELRSERTQQTRVYPYPLGAGSARPNPKMGAPDPENPLFLGFSVLRGGLRPWSQTMVSEGARPWGRGRSGDCEEQVCFTKETWCFFTQEVKVLEIAVGAFLLRPGSPEQQFPMDSGQLVADRNP